MICGGGCAYGHPRTIPDGQCHACRAQAWTIPRFNIAKVVYDEYQIHDMMQTIQRVGIAWTESFGQTTDRLIADSELYHLALTGRLAHTGKPKLREHVQNARAKLQKDEDSRMRIVKAGPARKVDLVVAASMAVHECLYLLL